MKTLTKTTTMLMMALTILISSCKKDDDSNNTTPTSGNITSGTWRVSYYHESNDDHSVDFNGYSFEFNDDGTMTATNSSGITSGSWNMDDSHPEFHISLGNSAPLNELSKGWLVISSSATQLNLQDDNSTHNEELHFTKN